MRKDDKIVGELLGDEHAITPSDLFARQFRRARFGGYDRHDVDEFLEQVADALENLIVQIKVLKEKNEEQRKKVADLKEVEASLRNALVSAQRFGDDVLDSAKREAHVILEEARLKRAEAQLEVSRVPVALTRDIHILEQQRSRLRVEMMAILETHRKLLDSLVPEDAMQIPTSFFETGADDGRLDHEDPEMERLDAPDDHASVEPDSEESALAEPVSESTAEPEGEHEPAAEEEEAVAEEEERTESDMEPESDTGDHILDGLEKLIDDTPPVREDVEVEPGPSLEDRIT